MSQPRVRRIIRVGLLLTIADTVLLALVYRAMHGGSFTNGIVTGTAPLTWLLAAVCAGIAGVVVVGTGRAATRARVLVAALAALAAVGVSVWPLSRVITSDVRPAMACYDLDMRMIDCPAPPDWTWLWVLAGLVVYLGAALVYGIANRRQEVRVRSPLLRLLFLLLALMPVSNIVGFIGFLWLEARESTPPLVAVGQSA